MNSYPVRLLAVVVSGLAVLCLGIVPIAGSPPERQDPPVTEEQKKAPPRPRRFTNEDLKNVRGNVSTSTHGTIKPTPPPRPGWFDGVSLLEPTGPPPEQMVQDQQAALIEIHQARIEELSGNITVLETNLEHILFVQKTVNRQLGTAIQSHMTLGAKNQVEIETLQKQRDRLLADEQKTRIDLSDTRTALATAIDQARNQGVPAHVIQAAESSGRSIEF